MPNPLRLASWAAVSLAALASSGCAVSPTPLTDVEVASAAKARLAAFSVARVPVNGTLTLEDAIARAVRYNLDHRVEIFETALRTIEVDAARASMLPGLVAGAAYGERDRPLASSSYNLVTNTQNFGYSTSQDETSRTADLAFSWHVLDFGLSYVRARQSADKALIAEENRRRVVHKLVEDVRSAYWRAYTAEIMRKRLRGLELRARAAITTSKHQSDDRTTSPVTAMTYRRELLEIRRTLQELQRELASAKVQLAALINESPGADFRLAAPKQVATRSLTSANVASLVGIAMERRPELREVQLRQRINRHEADAALLELLPGVQLFAGPNVDTNSFLLHGHWLSWGAKASWNLMRFAQYPARRDVIEAQDALLQQRDLALTLAIMTQIHVSRARLAVIEREIETAKAYATTQAGIVGHIRSEFAADKVSEQTLLREELNDAVGQIRYRLALAQHQSALAALKTAVGIDPVTAPPSAADFSPPARWSTRVVKTAASE